MGRDDLSRPPARGWWDRGADRYLAVEEAVTGGYGRFLVLSALVAQLGWVLPSRPAVLLLGVFVLGVGLGCAARLRRCRTAHCAITGVGLPVAAVLMIVQSAIAASWLNFYTWLIVVLAIGAAGFVFQAIWARTHHGSRAM